MCVCVCLMQIATSDIIIARYNNIIKITACVGSLIVTIGEDPGWATMIMAIDNRTCCSSEDRISPTIPTISLQAS